MSAPKHYQCPVCKGIVPDNVETFHTHLNSICCDALFSKYPGLKTEAFNSLWHKLDSMVKAQLIIPSGQPGVHALIHHSTQPTPLYYDNYSNHNRNIIDLEDIDRDIEYLQRTEKERLKLRAINLKRQRHEMEQRINGEINSDAFTLCMPKLSLHDTEPRHKKRKLLYQNTSDIRPPKRVNVDPIITAQLFQHKIRQTRKGYHCVSFEDCTVSDHKTSIIHSQKALQKYLSQCEMLRKCFNGKMAQKLCENECEMYSNNYERHMQCLLNEISVWKNVKRSDDCDENNENRNRKEEFLSSWDAIKDQTLSHHLDKLLERENLVGFYAKIEKDHSFWNASNNVKHGGYHKSIFDNAHSKKFIKL